MARHEVVTCDACLDEGVTSEAREAVLGVQDTWWKIDLCDSHQVALLGPLEQLLDAAGAPTAGPDLPSPARRK